MTALPAALATYTGLSATDPKILDYVAQVTDRLNHPILDDYLPTPGPWGAIALKPDADAVGISLILP